MKRVIGYVIAAALLAAAGAVCWVLGGAERRVAEAHQALATLQYETVAASADDLDQSLRLVKPLPRVGGRMASTVHEDQTAAEYWLARYSALTATRDAAGAVVESDPDVLIVAANAAYRSLSRTTADRQAAVRNLDGIIKSYAEVLKTADAPEDAAYNYEFLVRQRDAITRGRGQANSPQATEAVHPSIHGHQGGPPKDVEMSTFQIIIPRQNEEREEELKPGTGEIRQRKG
jgi:hypothetical protein